MTSSPSPSPRPLLVSALLLVDVLLILVFAISGRDTHAEALSVTGVLDTAWPFVAGLALAWLVTRSWRHPLTLWPHGICLWLITVVGGMAFRLLSGDTAALSFVLVATLVLGLFLVLPRLLLGLVLRRRRG